jgi:23S rRNA (cytidine1920-2'-O)/16S rRNA (cytidine1409-2'-O)-methyltransferase
MPKVRLDNLMVERKLADSRAFAQRLVMAGQVRINGQVALKPSVLVLPDVTIQLEESPIYVSRGGDKLVAALEGFRISPHGWVCADVGASTGGFTDCLLQHGAAKVYAIDVGNGILHWKIRQDRRVVVMEGTNARYLSHLPESVRLVTIDASFISLKTILPVVIAWFQPGLTSANPVGEVIALIKPQFEAGRKAAAKAKGVIQEPAVHREILSEVLGFAQGEGYAIRGLMPSPLLGPKGNREFFAWLSYPAEETEPALNLEGLISQVSGI